MDLPCTGKVLKNTKARRRRRIVKEDGLEVGTAGGFFHFNVPKSVGTVRSEMVEIKVAKS